MISLLGVRTVDDSEDSPEQEDDDECERLFALHAGDALDEDEIERERRHDDRRIEQLHTYDTIRDAVVRVQVYSSLCHLNLQSRNPILNSFANRRSVCVEFRSLVPKDKT